MASSGLKLTRSKFASKNMVWPAPGVRRVSINSFGFGGTNAHVILDDAYHYLKERHLSGNHATKISETEASSKHTNNSNPNIYRVFVWSAFDEASVERQLSKYLSYLKDTPKHKHD